MANCLGGYASFEDVQARVQHERIFQLVSLGLIAGTCGREERNVQRVVL
jgi:hypothetical protein